MYNDDEASEETANSDRPFARTQVLERDLDPAAWQQFLMATQSLIIGVHASYFDTVFVIYCVNDGLRTLGFAAEEAIFVRSTKVTVISPTIAVGVVGRTASGIGMSRVRRRAARKRSSFAPCPRVVQRQALLHFAFDKTVRFFT
jgi:hypothetical protein